MSLLAALAKGFGAGTVNNAQAGFAEQQRQGGIRRLVRVEGDVGDLRGEVDRPVWQDDGERIGGRLLFDGKRHSVDRGVALQSADVHAGDIDVRENGVASL